VITVNQIAKEDFSKKKLEKSDAFLQVNKQPKRQVNA
jgi:hypothetical protein